MELFNIQLPHGFHGGALSLLVSLTLFFRHLDKFTAETDCARRRGYYGLVVLALEL